MRGRKQLAKTNFFGLSVRPSSLGMWQHAFFFFSCFFFSFQHHEHHLGAIRAPTCQCSLSVTKVADLLRVGFFSWSELSKLATFLVCLKKSRSSAEATTKDPRGTPRRFVAWEIIHYCMLSRWENVFRFFFFVLFFFFLLITNWNDLAVMGTNYFT